MATNLGQEAQTGMLPNSGCTLLRWQMTIPKEHRVRVRSIYHTEVAVKVLAATLFQTLWMARPTCTDIHILP